jgi:hypothetical protein
VSGAVSIEAPQVLIREEFLEEGTMKQSNLPTVGVPCQDEAYASLGSNIERVRPVTHQQREIGRSRVLHRLFDSLSEECRIIHAHVTGVIDSPKEEINIINSYSSGPVHKQRNR